MHALEKTFYLTCGGRNVLSEKEFYNGLINFGIPININESKCIFESLKSDDGLHFKNFLEKIRVNFLYKGFFESRKRTDDLKGLLESLVSNRRELRKIL